MNLSQITELDLDSGKTKFYKKEVLDLYYRVLCNSNSWDLGLGFFSLSSMKLLAYPLAKFILNNEGKMRVYCNERLSENDYNIITENKVIPINKTILFDDLSKLYDSLKGNDQELFSQCISFLIQTDRIEFKVLVCKDSSRGISHHKNSIFKDANNNTIVLSGSANASEQAFIFNREDTNAFCSFWNEKSSNKTIKTTIAEFEKTFHEGDEDWNILEIDSQELKDKLDEIGFRKIDKDFLQKSSIKFIKKNKSFSIEIQKEIENELKQLTSDFNPTIQSIINKFNSKETFSFPIEKLRDYQNEAIISWENNNNNGILAMATGTGKTFTAFGAIYRLLKKQNAIIFICCPYQHLIDQWGEQIKSFGVEPILVYSGKNWKNTLLRKLRQFSKGEESPLFIVATNHSILPKNAFSKIMEKYWEKTFFIADEAHNVGSGNYRKALPPKTIAKLGLSATIDRYFDDLGTDFLKEYFEGVVYELSLKNAIGKYLVEYYYYAIPVELEKEKFEEYISLSKSIQKMSVMSDDIQAEENLKMLLMKRARLVNNCKNKIEWLRNNIEKGANLEHTLFYVGDELFRSTIDLLSNEKNIVAQPFYGGTKSTKRPEILEEFDKGIIKCLVAMKCLDEGVDVPATKTAYFIANSGNPKEFIQRRGRVLRKSPETGKEFAILYDLVSVPPNYIDRNNEDYETAKSSLKTQFKRIREFASLARNKQSSLNQMNELIDKFNLYNVT
jgi:superfamily II DNA or RNA helicase